MRSLRATLSAFLPSREAMATISLHSPNCMPGITLRTPMPAVLSTPHFTFLWLTSSLLGPVIPFYHASVQWQNLRVRPAFVLPPLTAYNHADAAVPCTLRACNSVLLLGRSAIADGYDRGRLDPLSRRFRRCGALLFPEQEPRFDADLFQSVFNPLCVTATSQYAGGSFSLRCFCLIPATHQSLDYRYPFDPLPAVSAPGTRTADQDSLESISHSSDDF